MFDGHEIPRAWRVGDFELEVAELTRGRLDRESGLLRGVAGKAWLHLPCAQPPIHPGIHVHPEARALTHSLEVVTEVLHPQTEISLADAQRLRPGVALGDTVPLPLAVDRADLQEIVSLGRGVRDWLDSDPRAGGYAVEFSELTVSLADARVIDGSVKYTVAGPYRGPIEIVIEGFVLVISSLELTPHRSTATATVRLPGGITDADSCGPATIDLGQIALSPPATTTSTHQTRPTDPGSSETPAWSSRARATCST